MSRTLAVISLSFLMVWGCGDRLHNKDLVQQAILKRLKEHSGLDLNDMDVTTTSVTFDKKMAYATVSFHPKSDPGVNSGILMKYTLQERDGEWQVTNVGDSHGGSLTSHTGGQMGGGQPGGAQLPPGHPEVDNLPPGHPQPQGSAR